MRSQRSRFACRRQAVGLQGLVGGAGEVVARREGAPRAPYHQDFDGVVARGLGETLIEGGEDQRTHRVQLLRPVQRERPHAVLLFKQHEVFRHVAPPFTAVWNGPKNTTPNVRPFPARHGSIMRPMLSHEQRVEALRSEYERLAQHLRSLDADGLAAPSACEGWSAADVAAHLAWNARLYVRSLGMGLAGEAPPPAPPGGGVAKITPDFVRDRSIEVRKKLGDGVLDSFEEHNARFIDMLDGLDPAVRETLTVPFLNDTIPLRRLIGLRINEVALHSWDVRSSADSEAALLEDAGLASIELWRDTIVRRAAPRAGGAHPHRPRRRRRLRRDRRRSAVRRAALRQRGRHPGRIGERRRPLPQRTRGPGHT